MITTSFSPKFADHPTALISWLLPYLPTSILTPFLWENFLFSSSIPPFKISDYLLIMAFLTKNKQCIDTSSEATKINFLDGGHLFYHFYFLFIFKHIKLVTGNLILLWITICPRCLKCCWKYWVLKWFSKLISPFFLFFQVSFVRNHSFRYEWFALLQGYWPPKKKFGSTCIIDESFEIRANFSSTFSRKLDFQFKFNGVSFGRGSPTQ